MTTDALLPSPEEIKKSHRSFFGSLSSDNRRKITSSSSLQTRTIGLKSNTSVYSKQFPWCLALPVHKPPSYSIEISSLTGTAASFCSWRVSNKINLFQGSNCRLFQKSASQNQRPAEKPTVCIYLLKDPFPFFLHFYYVHPKQEHKTADHLLLGKESALGQPSSTTQRTQREYNALLLKELSLSKTTTLELKAYPISLSVPVSLQFQFIRS